MVGFSKDSVRFADDTIDFIITIIHLKQSRKLKKKYLK